MFLLLSQLSYYRGKFWTRFDNPNDDFSNILLYEGLIIFHLSGKKIYIQQKLIEMA